MYLAMYAVSPGKVGLDNTSMEFDLQCKQSFPICRL